MVPARDLPAALQSVEKGASQRLEALYFGRKKKKKVRRGEDVFGANPHELLFLLNHWSRRQAPHGLPLAAAGAVP